MDSFGVIALEVILTFVAFIWAARCLREEINSVPSSPDA